MPKETPIQELTAIRSVVRSHPEGIAAAGIRGGLGISLPERTLQRRLNRLEQEGWIRSEGSGKGKKYFPIIPSISSVLEEEAVRYNAPPASDSGTVLSPEAREIRAYVRAPLSHRTPVGYDASFLADYQPNRTFYLPQETRDKLAGIGRVSIPDLPAGTYLRRIMDRLLIDLAWNSSRLEGNTYSLLETQRLLELGELADGKGTLEAQMILNHKAAIEMLADQAEEIGFNSYTVLSLHALLSDNLMHDPSSCGRVRFRPVGISGTVFHPLEVPQRIEEYFQTILSKAEAIRDPFEAAFFAMVHLPYLQAFEDVNKRVSRLAANIPLIRHNLCPLSFVDVEADDYLNGLIGVYELKRVEYLRDVFVWAYTRSAQRYSAIRESLGDPDPFRLKYRNEIGDVIRRIVQGKMTWDEAERQTEETAREVITSEDHKRFHSTVKVELRSLHEGNIARYRLRPREFADWKGVVTDPPASYRDR